MKKNIAVMAIAILFPQAQSVQAQSVLNLCNNCVITPSAKFILTYSGNQQDRQLAMSEYVDDADTDVGDDGTTFHFEMSAMYQWEHTTVPLSKIANDIWSLIKEGHQNRFGRLSKSTSNFIPTSNIQGLPMIIVIAWNKTKEKWVIAAIPLSGVKAPHKGVRMFSLHE
jgi:hypothetical protein